MNAYVIQIGVWATEGVLALVVVGLIRLWIAHLNFREEVARSYVRHEEVTARFDKVDQQMDELRRTSARVLELVAEIRGRTNANISHDG